MGVPDKAERCFLIKKARLRLQSRGDVAPGFRAIQRRVDQGNRILRPTHGQTPKKIQLGGTKLPASKIEGNPGHFREGTGAFGKGDQIVVISANDRAPHRPNDLQTLCGIGPIPHQIPQTKRMGHPLLLHVRQHRLQGFQIPMNIPKNSVLHRRVPALSFRSLFSRREISRSTTSGLRAGSGGFPIERRSCRKYSSAPSWSPALSRA